MSIAVFHFLNIGKAEARPVLHLTPVIVHREPGRLNNSRVPVPPCAPPARGVARAAPPGGTRPLLTLENAFFSIFFTFHFGFLGEGKNDRRGGQCRPFRYIELESVDIEIR